MMKSLFSPQFSQFQEIKDLWLSLKRGDALPPRIAFDAFALKPWLPNIALVDAVGSPPRFRVRLAGTGVNAAVGRELTGRYLDDALRELVQPDAVPSYLAVHTEAMSRKQPTRDSIPLRPSGREETVLHRLVLPCGADGATVDSFVVAIFAEKTNIRDARLS
jgi:hypothetical protein